MSTGRLKAMQTAVMGDDAGLEFVDRYLKLSVYKDGVFVGYIYQCKWIQNDSAQLTRAELLAIAARMK